MNGFQKVGAFCYLGGSQNHVYMASNIVFTDSNGSVKVEWNDGTDKVAYLQKEDYTLLRNGTQFSLIPSGAGMVDFGDFQNSDLVTPYADADALEAAIGPLFDATVVINGSITASITGMSTAAKQDLQTAELVELNARIGDNVTPGTTVNAQLSQLVSTSNSLATAANQTTTNDYIGADETGTTLRGRIKTWYDAAITFFSTVTGAISNNKFKIEAGALPLPTGAATEATLATMDADTSTMVVDLAAVKDRIGDLSSPAAGSSNQLLALINATNIGIATATGGKFDELIALGTPKTPTVPQLDTQGETTGYLDVTATSGGSFTWEFTLGAGTSGILTLYGSDGGVDELIAATASQVGDASGVIRWTTPYKTVKAVFSTQVGAGSTFDGQVYAF